MKLKIIDDTIENPAEKFILHAWALARESFPVSTGEDETLIGFSRITLFTNCVKCVILML